MGELNNNISSKKISGRPYIETVSPLPGWPRKVEAAERDWGRHGLRPITYFVFPNPKEASKSLTPLGLRRGGYASPFYQDTGYYGL